MADKLAAPSHHQVHTCPTCQAQYTSAAAVMWCCDDRADSDRD